VPVVLRGLFRVSTSLFSRSKAWMPTDLVREMKTHGTRPAKTKLGARCPFLHGCEIFPRTTQQLGGGGRVRGLLRYRLFNAASASTR
jgi:hypothetical protein